MPTAVTAMMFAVLAATPVLDEACTVHGPAVVWAEKPTGEDLERVVTHREDPPTTRTELLCSLGSEGRPRRCIVTREEPAGFGFGEAALSIAPRFRVAAKPGERLEGRCVRIPITWNFD